MRPEIIKHIVLIILFLNIPFFFQDQRDYLFFRDEKTIFLNNVYPHEKKIIEIPMKKYVEGIGDLEFYIRMEPSDENGYRFIDKNGFERPEDNVVAGESATETTHRRVLYRVYRNPEKKMPIAPRIAGNFHLDLYSLQFLFDKNHSEYQQITWSDFHPQASNDKLLALNEKRYKEIDDILEIDLKTNHEIKKQLEILKKQPARILYKTNNGEAIVPISGYLVPKYENPFENIPVETSGWGHRGWHFSNYYLSRHAGSNYEPIEYACVTSGLVLCHKKDYVTKAPDSYHIFIYNTNIVSNGTYQDWRNSPIFEGGQNSSETIYKQKLIMFHDDRSPWYELYNYALQNKKRVVGTMTPKKEVEHYEEAKAAFLTNLENVKGAYELLCNNKNFPNNTQQRRDCINLNNQLYEVVKRRIELMFQPLLNGTAAQIIALEKELEKNNLRYPVYLSDFKKPEELREKAYNANTYNYQRIELNHAKESEFQVRPGNNVNVEKSSIIFARESISKNLLDYLYIPTKVNLAKEEGVNIELKDEEGKKINFELNTFKFTPSDYGTQPFKGFVAKQFDNGIFSFPLTIQMSKIFFKTADIDVCQYEDELLDLSKYINVPFNPKTMFFVSKDFMIVEKNGEKKYINLDHVEPIKDGRIYLITEDSGEIPGSVTVKPNIPLPAFNENPFFVCGQPLIVKRKNTKNSGQYEYDLNDLMKGFPANSQFFWMKSEGDFVELKDGILKTPLANVQKFQIRSDYTSAWGTCKNERIIEVDLRKAPDVPTVENQVNPGEEYMHLCNNEWPFIKFTSKLADNNNTWRVYDQKIAYFDVEKVENYDYQIGFPDHEVQYQAPHPVKNLVYAYEYSDSTKCLSRPLELIFSTDKERDLKFLVGQNQLKPGEATVVFLPETEHKDFKDKEFKYTFFYKKNAESEVQETNQILGNFFEYIFDKEGFYDIRLDFDYKKTVGKGHCILNKTNLNMVEVKKLEEFVAPEPILAEIKMRNGNVHIFVDKELVDVYVAVMPTAQTIGKLPLFAGYFEFFKDFDIFIPPHISYLVTIYRGKKPDKKNIIFKQKIYSFGNYSDEYKKEKNIKPDFKN